MKRKTRVKLLKFRRTFLDIAKRLLIIAAGSSLIAITFNAFVIPYGLLSGGISGLALLGNYIFNIPVYLGIFLLNIPIFLWLKKQACGLAVGRRTDRGTSSGKPYTPVPNWIFSGCIFASIGGGLGLGSSRNGASPGLGHCFND